jgi:hypothetical protein
MTYIYPKEYGSDSPGDYDTWHPLIHEGLAQHLREEKVSIDTLCATIHKESQTLITQSRRWGPPPHERLFHPYGGYAVVDDYVCIVNNHNIVEQRLYPLREFWQRVFTQTESLHHLWTFWTNAIAQAEKEIIP